MPRSFVSTTLHSDLKYGDLKMVCICGDNLNILDFDRNLDMKLRYTELLTMPCIKSKYPICIKY